jgi:hypothetical protein
MSLSSIEVLPILQRNINKISHDILFIPEFEKDALVLKDKFETLGHDLKVFIETGLKLYHVLNVDNEGIRILKNLNKETGKIYEAFKFACRAVKGKGARSGIKVVYAHFEKEKRIELIEIYYQEDKEDPDQERLTKYYNL